MNAKTEIKLPVKAHLTIIDDADGLSILYTGNTGFSHEQCCAQAAQAALAINCHAKLVEALDTLLELHGQAVFVHEDSCDAVDIRKAIEAAQSIFELAKGGA